MWTVLLLLLFEVLGVGKEDPLRLMMEQLEGVLA